MSTTTTPKKKFYSSGKTQPSPVPTTPQVVQLSAKSKPTEWDEALKKLSREVQSSGDYVPDMFKAIDLDDPSYPSRDIPIRPMAPIAPTVDGVEQPISFANQEEYRSATRIYERAYGDYVQWNEKFEKNKGMLIGKLRSIPTIEYGDRMLVEDPLLRNAYNSNDVIGAINRLRATKLIAIRATTITYEQFDDAKQAYSNIRMDGSKGTNSSETLDNFITRFTRSMKGYAEAMKQYKGNVDAFDSVEEINRHFIRKLNNYYEVLKGDVSFDPSIIAGKTFDELTTYVRRWGEAKSPIKLETVPIAKSMLATTTSKSKSTKSSKTSKSSESTKGDKKGGRHGGKYCWKCKTTTHDPPDCHTLKGAYSTYLGTQNMTGDAYKKAMDEFNGEVPKASSASKN